MKLVLFQQSDAGPQLPGMLTDRGVVDISGVVRSSYTPQLVMEGIIDDFEKLRPTLEMLAETATSLPLSSVRLRAPLPRPHKILCALANYWEHAQRAPRPHAAPITRVWGRCRMARRLKSRSRASVGCRSRSQIHSNAPGTAAYTWVPIQRTPRRSGATVPVTRPFPTRNWRRHHPELRWVMSIMRLVLGPSRQTI